MKGYYGNLNERQFRKIYQKASQMRGDTSENIIGLLESRLDALVYRMKFAITVFAARQLISHGHVMVNGKVVHVASYKVNEGDVIEIRPKSKENAVIAEAMQSSEREIPPYLDVDANNMKGTYVHVPKLEDVPYPVAMEPSIVVEFYSR